MLRRALGWLVFACVFAAAVGPSSADDAPDVKTLRARMADAAGKAPGNFRETILGHGSFELKEITYRLGDDVRRTFDRGPVHEERGMYHGERWHQDANGLTIVDEAEPDSPRADTLRTTVARVTTPVDAYLIAQLNVRGHGTREYVDPQTYLRLREDSIEADGT